MPMRLAFMTWACPNWTVEQIVEAAKRYGYEGVEFRLSVGHRHGVEVDMSEERKLFVRRLFKDEGIQICCLASGVRFSSADATERERMVEQAKAEIELASDLGCPCVRVFGGGLPEGVARSDAHRYIADCLRQLGEFAQTHGVFVCLETHDAFSKGEHAAEVVRLANHPQVGIVWDIRHPLAQGETMREAFEHVKPFVRHCHIGDRKRVDGKWQFTQIGDGEVPVGEAIALLRSIGYAGFLSFEPEGYGDLDAETLLSEYAKRMRALMERQ
jgi:sugar phosphate isomerase/epimerase